MAWVNGILFPLVRLRVYYKMIVLKISEFMYEHISTCLKIEKG